MKWEVQLYVSGSVFKEEVHAKDYQDAKDNGLGMFLMTVLTQMTFVGFLVILCILLA